MPRLTPVPRRSTLIFGAANVLINRLALRLGLRRRQDGWRRAAGLMLRGENATFVLSSFGLDVWSNAPRPASIQASETEVHLARRLKEFFAKETTCHFCIHRGSLEDHVHACDGPSYTLDIQPFVEGPCRFVRPDHWSGDRSDRPPTGQASDVLLNIVCRVDDAGHADLWMRVNHIGMDGVPAQEMLTRLQASWGVPRTITYPTVQAFVPYAVLRSCAGRPGLAEIQTFIDFTPLLAWRKEQNLRVDQPMTLAAAILWRLGHHPAFAGLHFGTTVETAAIDGLARAVGLVVVRPADYFHRDGGLRRYVNDFNRELELTRRRASSACKTLDAAALLSPRPAATLLRHALEHAPRAFGSMGLTILKDAQVFGAPIADAGNAHGFLAIGGVALPSDDGRKVGCVCIKGPPDVISDYPTIIQQLVQGS